MTSTPRTIGITPSIAAIKANPNRISLAIFNKHATAIIYMKEGGRVSAASGIPVYPTGNVSLNEREDGKTVQEAWSLISDTADTPIVIFEGSK